MNTEIDTKEIVEKLSFLVGRTVLFRDSTGATCATVVNSIKMESHDTPRMTFYYGLGIEHLTSSKDFNNIMVLESDGSLKCLGDYAKDMGICF